MGGGRWIGVVAVVLVLAGCGIDSDKLTSTVQAQTTTTEPLGRTANAANLLLDASDLGPDWTRSNSGGADLTMCRTATGRDGTLDFAGAVFVRGGANTVLAQSAAVYASAEQARRAVALFKGDLGRCANAVVHVETLSLPHYGDESAAARMTVGAHGLGATEDVACVRVGRNVTRLGTIVLREGGSEQFATAVKKAADKLSP